MLWEPDIKMYNSDCFIWLYFSKYKVTYSKYKDIDCYNRKSWTKTVCNVGCKAEMKRILVCNVGRYTYESALIKYVFWLIV